MMSKKLAVLSFVLACVIGVASLAGAADLKQGMMKGSPELKSAAALAFGPEGILFVGDTWGASVVAIDTGDKGPASAGVKVDVANLGDKIAALLGTSARDVLVNDLAVNPASGSVYLAVSRGRGPEATPVLLRVGIDGKVSEFSTDSVSYSKAALPDTVDGIIGTGRRETPSLSVAITDIDFVEGKVFVAGIANDKFESTFRSIPFPFTSADRGTSVKFFHGSHGRVETKSPVRTFTHYKVEGEPVILAAYTCTPLVKVPVSQLVPGESFQATTIAELGNHNSPLDMFVYKQGGKDFILMANSSRGVMKVTTENIADAEPITEETGLEPNAIAGVPYETIENISGVEQLDRLDDTHAVVLVRADEGALNLQTIELP